MKFGIATDLNSDSFQNDNDQTDVSIKVKYQDGKERVFDKFIQKPLRMGHTETRCIEIDEHLGNVSNAFLMHNLGYSSMLPSSFSTFKLKISFIKIQDFPGSTEYTSWFLGNPKNSFWISKHICKQGDWCEMSKKCNLKLILTTLSVSKLTFLIIRKYKTRQNI